MLRFHFIQLIEFLFNCFSYFITTWQHMSSKQRMKLWKMLNILISLIEHKIDCNMFEAWTQKFFLRYFLCDFFFFFFSICGSNTIYENCVDCTTPSLSASFRYIKITEGRGLHSKLLAHQIFKKQANVQCLLWTNFV